MQYMFGMSDRVNQGARIAIVGVGAVGRTVCRLLGERGASIVGAYNRPGVKSGQDVGLLSGLGRNLGVPVSDDLGAMLASASPDIAIVAIGNYIAEMLPIYTTCLEAATNVLCAGTETSFAWPSSPALSRELDDIAKRAGRTVTGGGNQDFMIIRCGVHLAGVCHRIERMTHQRTIDAGNYGAVVADQVHLGLASDEIDSATFVAESGHLSIYETFGRQAVADIGWHVSAVSEQRLPVVSDRPLHSAALGTTVEPGRCSGLREICELTTEEGPIVRIDASLRLLAPEEHELIEWRIDGQPNVKMALTGASSSETTATQLINRIPDVIAAPAGYVTLDRLPPVRYHQHV